MALAPTKTQTPHHLATFALVPPLSNPPLERLKSALAEQNRELDAASSLVSGLADVPFVVHADVLREIDLACTPRAASSVPVQALARC